MISDPDNGYDESVPTTLKMKPWGKKISITGQKGWFVKLHKPQFEICRTNVLYRPVEKSCCFSRITILIPRSPSFLYRKTYILVCFPFQVLLQDRQLRFAMYWNRSVNENSCDSWFQATESWTSAPRVCIELCCWATIQIGTYRTILAQLYVPLLTWQTSNESGLNLVPSYVSD